MEEPDELSIVREQYRKLCEVDRAYRQNRNRIEKLYDGMCEKLDKPYQVEREKILKSIRGVLDKNFREEVPRLNSKLPSAYQIEEWEIHAPTDYFPVLTITKIRKPWDEGDAELFEKYVSADLREIERKFGVRIYFPSRSGMK